MTKALRGLQTGAQNPRMGVDAPMPVPYITCMATNPYRTPEFLALKKLWDKKLKDSGLEDIEYYDRETGEPQDFLKGINTAQILAMGRRRGGRIPELDSERIHTREEGDAGAARMRFEAQRDWFILLEQEIPRVNRRWGARSQRAKAFALYARGARMKNIAVELGMTFGQVKVAVAAETRRVQRKLRGGRP